MIKTFEQYGQKPHIFTFIVGIPSGEYFEVTTEQYVKLNNANLILFDNQHGYFIFQDHNYEKVANIVLENREEDKIKQFLQKNNITKYRINNDFTIEALQNVRIQIPMSTLPVNFDFILGDFDISNCGLEDLRGCPEVVQGDFICVNNNLIDLKMGPKKVNGKYKVRMCGLLSLEGAPETVGGDFDCGENQIRSLKGGPKKVGGDYFCDNSLLTSLEGSPNNVNKGDFDCSFNYLKTLKGGPQSVFGLYDCSNNELSDIEGAPTNVRVFKCNGNKELPLKNLPKAGRIISDEI